MAAINSPAKRPQRTRQAERQTSRAQGWVTSTLTCPFRRFARGEAGAVTVDWVVLTAAMLSLAIVAINTAAGGVDNASTDVKKCLKRQANVLLKKESWDYDRRMRVAARRCGRL
ncbi:MAG: hypothetical protein QNJ16_06705 [Rhodobacter sp.]|nr:hypothetical protein [Rhodobacter sp.]